MSTPRTAKVLTLNLWNRSDPWEERLAVIRAGLERMQPDVVCLQEVLALPDFDQAAAIADGLGYAVAFGDAGSDHYLFGNAILSRWPVLASESRPLPRCGTHENRLVLRALLDSPHGRMPVLCTHLNWRFEQGHVRVAQVQDIVRFADATFDEGHLPAVLAGDFNAEPGSDEIRYLRGFTGLGGPCVHFVDCWAAAGLGDGATFVRRNPYARTANEPDRRIDYVFVRGPNDRLEGSAEACEVAFDGPVDGAWASDHRGVFATIGF